MYNNLITPPNKTPQSEKAREDQVPNRAGGFGFALDKWQRLEQFLVLGSASGTYYVSARDLTKENLDVVKVCIAEDGSRVVKLATEMSVSGRAIKNDTCILVLALVLSVGDAKAKQAASAALTQVCRTGTHILHFAAYASKLRGWGRALRSTITNWYTSKEVDALAYQVVKYQSRDGWSHRDLLRLTHPDTKGQTARGNLYNWIVKGYDAERAGGYPEIVRIFEAAKTAKLNELIQFIGKYNLSREMISTTMLNDPAVAEALAFGAAPEALIRNLGNYSKLGLLAPGSLLFKHVLGVIGDTEKLKRARIHPIFLLIALKPYTSGRGVRGKGEWTVVPQIVSALDKAFYASFESVEPIGKPMLLAVDSSSSMHSEVTNTPGFSAAQASAAMALLAASIEPAYTLVAFDTGVYPWSISPRSRLDDVMANIPGGGGTDVSAPINYATSHKLNVDSIVIYTDNQTWYGHDHPYQAMQEYRKRVNAKARLVIVAATADGISVAAPDDPLSLTICGFDPTVPAAIREFLKDS